MFRRRLIALLVLLALVFGVVVLRLGQLQLVWGQYYTQLAADSLVRPEQFLAPTRGAIRDRWGQLIAADRPAWEITVRYEVLAEDAGYLRRLARLQREDGLFPPDLPIGEVVARLGEQIDQMWPKIAPLAEVPVEKLFDRRDRVLRRVSAMKRYLQRFEPITRIREEQIGHAVASGLSQQAAVEARLALADLPWVAVVPGTRRSYVDAEPLCHLLGRLGPITAENIADHPPAINGDPLRGYGPGDLVGIAGVEKLAESALRGRRGLVRPLRDGTFDLRIEPVDGHDVRLSIDAELQRQIWRRLGEAVESNPTATGGSAVVLDVATRQVLALVSYPTYRPGQFDRMYPALRRDTRTLPLLFRAVAGEYPPGSPFKLVAAVAGLASGTIDPQETIFCQGYLHNPEAFRCWIYQRPGPKQHGPLDLVGGIKNSCNVYFYTIGERLGVDRLCQWYELLGIGQPPVIGLPEERVGINPTPEWIQRHRRRGVQTADARLFAIGQGLPLITPLQQANVAASLASGEWISPQILLDGGPEPVCRPLPIKPELLALVREGMWKVVNEPGGTAYRGARLTESPYREDLDLFGKTGSAETSRRVTEWRYRLVLDEHEPMTLIARDDDEFRDQLAGIDAELAKDVAIIASADHPRRVARLQDERPGVVVFERRPAAYWPPRLAEDEDVPTHAWFMGFVQRREPGHGGGRAQVAMAVIVEYGGGGPSVSAPIGQDIAKLIHDSPHDYLGLHGPPALARARP